MAGRHASGRTRWSLILTVAAVAVAVLVGVAVAGVRQVGRSGEATAATGSIDVPGPGSTGSGAPAATEGAGPAPTASPSASRSPDRSSRGGARSAAPSAQPSPTRPASRVTSSGACGASYYDQGQVTATGEQFDPEALTAAHKTWAFDTRVRVTNPANGRSVVVRINDRGPYIDGRCIDLSRAAFRAIASLDLGHVDVRYEVLAN